MQSSRNAQSLVLGSAVSAISALLVVFSAACGRKGPPLPPLVKEPVAPAELSAARRGDLVDVSFLVPGANTDGTRPANIDRVDVYAFTGPDVKDELLLKARPKVASVPVKAPRDPNATIEEDEPAEAMEPPEGKGADQGARVHVEAALGAAPLKVLASTGAKKKGRARDEETTGPLAGMPPDVPSATFVAIGVTPRGRLGRLSSRVHVALAPPPAPPSALTLTYDESSISLAWTPPPIARALEPAAGEVLPSTLIGLPQPGLAYHVYELPPASDVERNGATGDAPTPVGNRLTGSPIADAAYGDNRMAWGTERCYAVRAVAIYDNLAVESDATPASCVKLVDTFPPAPPKGLQPVGSEGAINLIWQPNQEKDLAGYIILRGTSAETLEPITLTPIQDATFRDVVPPGAHYFYAVKAVDKAGNASAASEPQEATAR